MILVLYRMCNVTLHLITEFAPAHVRAVCYCKRPVMMIITLYIEFIVFLLGFLKQLQCRGRTRQLRQVPHRNCISVIP